MSLPADFSKIFGSTATGGLTPISDVNYAKGWEFVGSNPPTKNDFSYLQNLSDLKAQWLYNNKLQRTDPFGDIKSDGAASVAAALSNLGFGNGTGWTKLPDGTVIQRGYVSGYSDYTVTLPVPYASLNFQVVATCEGTVAQAGTARAFVETVNTGPGTFTLSCVNAAGVATARAVKWIAVGKI